MTELLDVVLAPEHIVADPQGVRRFEERYGVLQKPLLIRFRILDPVVQLGPLVSPPLLARCGRASVPAIERGGFMGSWKKIAEGIWVRVYQYNKNALHTSAVALADGGLLVVSPGTDLGDDDFAELEKLGAVRALLAPGAFHNMGLPAWSARYPDAGLYGPAAAAQHIAKVHPKLAPLQDLRALSAVLPPDVEAFEVDGCAQPDALLIVRRADGTTWFTNEIITNWAGWPSSFMFKLMFKLSGSGPGLNVNTMALMFIKGRKPVVRAFHEAKLASHPPTRLVPCHGEVLEDASLKQRLAEVLARRLA